MVALKIWPLSSHRKRQALLGLVQLSHSYSAGSSFHEKAVDISRAAPQGEHNNAIGIDLPPRWKPP